MVTFPNKAFLNDRLTYRLDVLAQEAIGANDGIFQSTVGCSIREVRVLRLIDDYPGITFIEICRATGLERSLASRIIRRLLGRGFIRRNNATADGRRYELTTTPLGRQCRLAARALSDTLEEVLCRPLVQEEREQLKNMLDRLAVWVRSPEYAAELARQQANAQRATPRRSRAIAKA